MLYYLIKFTILLYSRIYFKRVFISGTEHIPKDQPVFLASNHSNGFIDGTMVSALIFPKSTRIFVRGDVFGKGWANFILRSLKLIPIYRARDGDALTNRDGNNKSFDQLYAEFKKNRIVLIFPEADAQIEKRLRPLKKGMARMIIDMQSRGDKDMEVAVVPFGLNYTHYKRHRNELMISFSKPVYLKDYLKEDGIEREAYNALTTDVGERIKKEMVDVNIGDDEVTETALRIVRSERRVPIMKFWVGSKARLQAEIDTANKIKFSNPDSNLRTVLTRYQNALDGSNTSEVGSRSVKLWEYTFWLIFIIPSSLSWLITRWGLFFGKRLVDAKVKKDELYESIYFGVGLAYNWILMLVGYPLCALFFGWWGIVGWFIFRWLSIPYQHCREIMAHFAARKAWKKNADELDTLRGEVLAELF